MSCTNPKQQTPLDNILTDVVVSTTGSRKLLNRLGCVSSAVSYDRFVTMHVECQHETNLWEVISPSTLTIASQQF